MADKQYDLPEKILKLFHERQKLKEKSKAYYARYITNPHRPMGEGAPFDPQLFKFAAAQRHMVEFYRPTAKNIPLIIMYYLLPVSLLAGCLYHYSNKKEKLIWSGLVAYKDRQDKIMY